MARVRGFIKVRGLCLLWLERDILCGLRFGFQQEVSRSDFVEMLFLNGVWRLLLSCCLYNKDDKNKRFNVLRGCEWFGRGGIDTSEIYIESGRAV